MQLIGRRSSESGTDRRDSGAQYDGVAYGQASRIFDQSELPYRLIEHRAAGPADEYHEVLGTRYEEHAKAVFLRHKGRHGARAFATLARGDPAKRSRRDQ
jgi:hypothetical protein